jgi:hypothetical protein
MRKATAAIMVLFLLAGVSQAGLIDTGILDLTGTDETFDGSSDSVNSGVTGSEIGLPGTGPKTLVAKFNTSADGIHTFLSYSPFGGVNGEGGGLWPGAYAGADLRLKLNADTDQLRFEISGGAETLDIDLNDGEDHVVAAVVPDTSNVTAADVYFIIDGVQYAGDGGSSTAIDTADFIIEDDQGDPNPNGSLDVIIGVDQADNYMEGTIDWVAIEDAALTADQIAALPEPATMSLLALGGLGVLIRRRK